MRRLRRRTPFAQPPSSQPQPPLSRRRRLPPAPSPPPPPRRADSWPDPLVLPRREAWTRGFPAWLARSPAPPRPSRPSPSSSRRVHVRALRFARRAPCLQVPRSTRTPRPRRAPPRRPSPPWMRRGMPPGP